MRHEARWAQAGAFLAGLAVVTTVAFVDGGYFRESWLWFVLTLSSLAGIVLVLVERLELRAQQLAALLAFTCLIAWTALSAIWSSAPSASLHDAERGLIYVALLLALLLALNDDNTRELVGGTAAAATVVATYSLADRLFATDQVPKDLVSGGRLVEPMGYANALGILVAIGLLLSLGLATHARGTGERVVWSSTPMLLASALTLTESRGAVVSLAVGLGALVLLDANRLRVVSTAVALAAPVGAGVVATWRSSVLTEPGATRDELSPTAWQLTLALGALTILAALAGGGIPRVEAALGRRRGTWIAPAFLGLTLIGLVVAVVVGVNRALGPRLDYWRVGWSEFRGHPWLGSGAGTFSEFWQATGGPVLVRDAHSVYVEALAELGPIGLLLLVVAFGIPLVSTAGARARPETAIAGAGYIAFLVHAGLDWDWEMPAVTITGLSCASVLLVGARSSRGRWAIGVRERSLVAVAVAAIVLVAIALRTLVE